MTSLDTFDPGRRVTEGLPFTFHKIDDQHYEVVLFNVLLGEVYYEPEAWSDRRWFVVGGRREVTNGGVCNKSRKLAGQGRTRYAAAYVLAKAQSNLITRSMP